jgi:LPXTG-motif cell wall-anchored protein
LASSDETANLHGVRFSSFSIEDSTVVKAIGLAVLLCTAASIASAHDFTNGRDECSRFAFFSHCTRFIDAKLDTSPAVVSAPEMDSASALAGLTLLAGGLVVLSGRRRQSSKA